MSIFEFYSESQLPKPESFVFDQFPKELKTQCKYVWNEFFVKSLPEGERPIYYHQIGRVLMKEHAIDELPKASHQTTLLDRINLYFDGLKEINRAMDVVQLLCYSMEHVSDYLYIRGYQFAPSHWTL